MPGLKTVTFDASQYRKKPVVISAHQWFKNGDHPEDGSYLIGDGHDEPFLSEGKIVRRYRNPMIPGTYACEQCGKPHSDHGWIDTLEQGHRVCPGDWIIKGIAGEFYPCKPEIFAATYEPAAAPTPAAQNVTFDALIEYLEHMYEQNQTGYGRHAPEIVALCGQIREWIDVLKGRVPTPAAQSAGQEPIGYLGKHDAEWLRTTPDVNASCVILRRPSRGGIAIYAAPVNGGERELGQVIDERAADAPQEEK